LIDYLGYTHTHDCHAAVLLLLATSAASSRVYSEWTCHEDVPVCTRVQLYSSLGCSIQQGDIDICPLFYIWSFFCYDILLALSSVFAVDTGW